MLVKRISFALVKCEVLCGSRVAANEGGTREKRLRKSVRALPTPQEKSGNGKNGGEKILRGGKREKGKRKGASELRRACSTRVSFDAPLPRARPLARSDQS